jgi:hypothetical protein
MTILASSKFNIAALLVGGDHLRPLLLYLRD